MAYVAGMRIRVAGLLHPATSELPTPAGMVTLSLVPTLVSIGDRLVSFTRIEERLFARLWIGRQAVIPASELIASAWLGRRVSAPTLQVHLSVLRRKLGKLGGAIESVPGQGYRFSLGAPTNIRKIRPSLRPRP